MEKEPQPHQNLEEILREKGYRIEEHPEENWNDCGHGNCFEEAHWFIEGSAYCPEHKETALKILEKADKEYEQEKAERKRAATEQEKRFRKLW